MKPMKTLGLFAVAAAALVAFTGPASATELTSPKGTKVGTGAEIKAESDGMVKLDGTPAWACQKSTMQGQVTNAGGSETTVTASLSSLTFSECGNHTVTVIKPGSLEVHGLGNGNGTLTWTGGEVTVLFHSLILGTVHCIYKTNQAHMGTLTGSGATGSTATLDIGESWDVSLEPTDEVCEVQYLTGNYKFTSPDSLYVDAEKSILTSPAGTKVGTGTKVKAASEGAIEFAGAITFSCQNSTIEGEVSNAGGEGATIDASVTKQTFTECGNHTVEVLKAGTLTIHSLENGNGTLTSTGAEITVLTHGVFHGTTHCIYKTSNTDLGTLTGSLTTGSTATLDIGPAKTEQSATDEACGSNAEWGGYYKVTSPDYLAVD